MNQQLGTPVGFLNPKLYTLDPSVFQDITQGTNDDSNLGYYSAKAGWDPCTGLGSPNGAAILAALGQGTTTTSAPSGNGTQAVSASHASSPARVQVPGSEPKHLAVDEWKPIANPGTMTCCATIVLRDPASSHTAADLLSGRAGGTRESPAGPVGANPAEVQKVVAFAKQYALSIVSQNPAARTVRVQGTVEQMDAAFGIDLMTVTNSHGEEYMTYKGPITVPADLGGVVVAVLGLDERPIAKAHGASST
jgi:subtilase family serine protease